MRLEHSSPLVLAVQDVSKAEAETLARDFGMHYFEASAKKGLGVEEAFRHIAEEVVDRLSKESGGASARGAVAAKGAEGAVALKAPGGKAGGGGGCCGGGSKA